MISIVGNAKNAGKTTVLNTLIQQYRTQPIAITSIGLDGEILDSITRLPKPRIHVYPGMIVATAKDTLRQSTADYDVIESLDIPTALGSIVFALVRQEGTMLVAGPSKVEELKYCICRLKQYQLDKILIDGAFARQQLSRVGDACILALGAASDYLNDQVYLKAKALMDKFQLPGFPNRYLDFVFPKTLMGLSEEDTWVECGFDSTLSFDSSLLGKLPSNLKILYFPHAVSETFCQAWMKFRHHHSIAWMIQSPAHLCATERTFMKIQQMNQIIYCRYPVNVVAITINPTRPHGISMDPDQMMKELQMRTHYPIFNVVREEANHEINTIQGDD